MAYLQEVQAVQWTGVPNLQRALSDEEKFKSNKIFRNGVWTVGFQFAALCAFA